MVKSDTAAETEYLPLIRQELALKSSARDINGVPRWTIYDPIQHQYYELTPIVFNLLANWQAGMAQPQFLIFLAEQNIAVSEEQLTEVLTFLQQNQLLDIAALGGAGQQLFDKHQQQVKSSFNKLLHGYLFFKIPLIKPEPWIGDIADKLLWLRAGWVTLLFFVAAVYGGFQVLQQWDKYTATFSELLNIQGFVLFVITLSILKVFHELGHAIAAKWRGCQVGSMGLAFLVLFPILYTDTTDSWRLTSRKERLGIVTAGLRVELKIAAVAMCLWSVLPPGVLQSLCFIIATTGVLSSLLVNLSPFMRFDGYFAMSDVLRIPNLQHRAFSIARWFIRYYLIGIREPISELFSRRFVAFLLLYSYATWIYRFFLFLGIAVFVYRIDFKLLGIFLFVVEIWYFIARPIVAEAKIWWQQKQQIRITKSNSVFLLCLILLILWLFMPGLQTLRLPAVGEAREISYVYVPQAGVLSQYGDEPKIVQKGAVLAQVLPTELLIEKNILDLRVKRAEQRLQQLVIATDGRQEVELAKTELADAMAQAQQVKERVDNSVILAPIAGEWIPNIGLANGRMVSTEMTLGTLYDRDSSMVIAYADFGQKQQLFDKITHGQFVPDIGLSVPVNITTNVSDVAEKQVTKPILASTFSGRILVRRQGEQFVPEQPIFRVFANSDLPWPYMTQMQGTLVLQAKEQAPIIKGFNWTVSVLLAESGF